MTVCALVGAADFNEGCFTAQWRAGRFASVIAVDGGFLPLEAIACVPDVVLGDFDSLGQVPEGLPKTTEVLTYPKHKDESDMELALMLARERGFDEVAVYGALGGRLDHTLANLQLLASFSEKGLRVVAIDLPTRDGAVSSLQPSATALTFLTGPASLTLEPHSGETISVFSLSDACLDVTEMGLAYPLDHVALTNRTSWGLSNEFTESPATITVGSGTLVVFHPLH